MAISQQGWASPFWIVRLPAAPLAHDDSLRRGGFAPRGFLLNPTPNSTHMRETYANLGYPGMTIAQVYANLGCPPGGTPLGPGDPLDLVIR